MKHFSLGKGCNSAFFRLPSSCQIARGFLSLGTSTVFEAVISTWWSHLTACSWAASRQRRYRSLVSDGWTTWSFLLMPWVGYPNTAWQGTLSYQFVLHASQLFGTLGLYQKNSPSRRHTFEAHPGAKYWLQLRTLGRSVWKVRQDIFCWNWHLLWKAVWSIHLCML